MLSAEIPVLENCLSSLPKALLETLTALKFPSCRVVPDTGYFLSCQGNKLILNTESGEKIQPELTRPAGFNSKQPLLRALAPARGGIIIDATAGLAGDSLKLAMIANRVIAIERNPVVFLLLQSALLSARSSSLTAAEKIEEKYGDACELIQHLPIADLIFMDPMFPPKRKRSALPPKAVRILRDVVGEDLDEKKLLRVARQYAKSRVVVKRPLHAPPLADDPVALHEGKTVRYEVYLPTGKSE